MTANTRRSPPILLILAVLIVLVLSTWLVSYGSWDLFRRELFGDYYDAQAVSMLQGRLDVPLEAIGDEYFLYDEKYYGYFGVVPALLRIPLLILFPGLEGRWSRVFMLAACLLNLALTVVLLRRAAPSHDDAYPRDAFRRTVYASFVLLIGLGTPSFFLLSRPFTFHEAILFSVSFAIAFYVAILSYLAAPRAAYLWLAGLCCFLSFQTRAVAGAGTLLTFGLLGGILLVAAAARRWALLRPIAARLRAVAGVPQVERPLLHASVICTLIALTVGFFFTINYLKFATFDGVPVQFYSQYLENPRRMEAVEGKQIHLTNLPTTAVNYFLRFHLGFTPHFPWLTMPPTFVRLPGARIDTVEGYVSVIASMPALMVLAFKGVGQICSRLPGPARAFRLPLVGALTASLLICFTVALTQRYMQEHLPLLLLSGVVGLHVILGSRRRRAWLALLAFLALFGIYTHLSISVIYQRDVAWKIWTPPATSSDIVRAPSDQPPASPLYGQLWIVGDDEAVLRYNGRHWVPQHGGPSQGLLRQSLPSGAP